MNNSDLILYLVEKLMTEREKNIILKQEIKRQQIQEGNKVKTNM